MAVVNEYRVKFKQCTLNTTAILQKSGKGMHGKGLQHTCYREYYYLMGSQQCG